MRLIVLVLCSTISFMAPLGGAVAHADNPCVDYTTRDPETGGLPPSGNCHGEGCLNPFVWDDMHNGAEVWVCP